MSRLTVVMPCLNEAETVGDCIDKAQEGLSRAGIAGEVLVADNGSSDNSIEIARQHGARVVQIDAKGYGNALRGGIEAVRTEWLIMGDADNSYDFSDINRFVEQLRAGYDLVMGCRLPSGGGTIMPGAMPWKNRWLGNPSLSLIGRMFFKTPVRDFHCGLRAFTRAAYERMDLKTTGMEFASEMVMKAALQSMRISEVPITLHRDGRSRRPHLRPWRDGWRHLRFMLIYSPRWSFLVPGLLIAGLGSLAVAILCWSPREVFGISLDLGAMLISSMAIIAGIQLVVFACFTKVFGIAEGLLPDDPKFAALFRYFTLERGVVAGLAVLLAGLCLLGTSMWEWRNSGFADASSKEHLRLLVLGATAVVVGVQIISSSFFMSVLGLNTTQRHPPSPGTRTS
jgi:glycosyltransferase involved in cell wall biosynthesis